MELKYIPGALQVLGPGPQPDSPSFSKTVLLLPSDSAGHWEGHQLCRQMDLRHHVVGVILGKELCSHL